MHLKCLPVDMQWTIVPAGTNVHQSHAALLHVQHICMHTLDWYAIRLLLPGTVSCCLPYSYVV